MATKTESIENVKASMEKDKEERAKADFRLAQKIDYERLKKQLLQNVKSNNSKTYAQYTKERIKAYIQSPATNIDNLREVSRFLARNSMIYKKFLEYYATIPLYYYNVVYKCDLTKEVNVSKALKSYQTVLKRLQSFRIKKEFPSVCATALRDGIFYGFVYDTEDEGAFIAMLDPAYCKIQSRTTDGQYVVYFNARYFDQGNNSIFVLGIDGEDTDGLWDDVFIDGYNTYKSNGRDYMWFELPMDKTICIPGSFEDEFDFPLPYFLPLFTSLLDLLDLEQILMSKTELENYILLLSKIPLKGNTDEEDDFAVSIDVVEDMQALIDSAVPDLVGTAYAPFELEVIRFDRSNTADDTDALSKSMTNMFANAGMSQLVVSPGNSSNSVGLKHSIQNDEALAFKMLERFEAWMQSYIDQNISADFMFKFHRCSYFNWKDYVDTLKESATLGGDAMDWLTAIGNTPYEAWCKIKFEQATGIKSMLTPLSSSYTQSGKSDGGAPEKDIDELSPEGLDTRESGKNDTTAANE